MCALNKFKFSNLKLRNNVKRAAFVPIGKQASHYIKVANKNCCDRVVLESFVVWWPYLVK